MMAALSFYGVQGRMTRRMAALVLGTQALAVFFGALVARALADVEDSGRATTYLALGSVLAVLCLLTAGLLRFPWGITLGWVLQLVTLACGFVVLEMLLVGLLFTGLWVTALVLGHKMEEMTRQFLEQQEQASGDDR